MKNQANPKTKKSKTAILYTDSFGYELNDGDTISMEFSMGDCYRGKFNLSKSGKLCITLDNYEQEYSLEDLEYEEDDSSIEISNIRKIMEYVDSNNLEINIGDTLYDQEFDTDYTVVGTDDVGILLLDPTSQAPPEPIEFFAKTQDLSANKVMICDLVKVNKPSEKTEKPEKQEVMFTKDEVYEVFVTVTSSRYMTALLQSQATVKYRENDSEVVNTVEIEYKDDVRSGLRNFLTKLINDRAKDKKQVVVYSNFKMELETKNTKTVHLQYDSDYIKELRD